MDKEELIKEIDSIKIGVDFKDGRNTTLSFGRRPTIRKIINEGKTLVDFLNNGL